MTAMTDRPSAETPRAQALTRLGSATLGESGGRTMRARSRAAWSGARVAAPAFPVRCTPGDNLAVHVAVTCAPTGSVLVVDVGDVPERGYWGEVLTTAAKSRGLRGLVIDGGVRDVAALRELAFPVFSAMVALPGAAKVAAGRVGFPVRVGGAPVALGDWVVGDEDGVVVVPGAVVDEVVEAGRVRAAKEQEMFERLRAGATTLELLEIDPGPVEVAEPGG